MTNMRAFFSVCVVSFLSLFFSAADLFAERSQALPLSVKPRGSLSFPINQQFSQVLKGSKLPDLALLEAFGTLPGELEYAANKPHQLTLSGTVSRPQSCAITVRALLNGSFSKNIAVEFDFTSDVNVYQGSATKLGETDSHIQYQVTAQNVAGIPITSATIRTLISGGAGGTYQVESALLPSIAPGESATTIIWHKKVTGIGAPFLVLEGQNESDTIEKFRSKRISGSFQDECTYEEIVANDIQQ